MPSIVTVLANADLATAWTGATAESLSARIGQESSFQGAHPCVSVDRGGVALSLYFESVSGLRAQESSRSQLETLCSALEDQGVIRSGWEVYLRLEPDPVRQRGRPARGY